MEVGKFLEHYTSRNRCIHSKRNGWDYTNFIRLAGLTEFINYHCRFTKDGRCRGNRSYYDPAKKFMCCCSNCHNTVGHNPSIPNDHEIIATMANLFSEVVEEEGIVIASGFWRKDSGCILQRKLRSGICLNYHCMSPGEYEAMPEWAKMLNSWIRYKPDEIKINGEKYTEYLAVKKLQAWVKEETNAA